MVTVRAMPFTHVVLVAGFRSEVADKHLLAVLPVGDDGFEQFGALRVAACGTVYQLERAFIDYLDGGFSGGTVGCLTVACKLVFGQGVNGAVGVERACHMQQDAGFQSGCHKFGHTSQFTVGHGYGEELLRLFKVA
ncbi:hypothetical protein Barb7_02667 [Bacteroidales bacterium Barb7]|nr:hypothetical protein Barb7_02667 [Bacteroidales bacterium Barb7]